MQIDTASRKLTLSVKSLEAAEEKKAMKEYGSSDSGASLGDILGAAFKNKENSEHEKADVKKDAPKKPVAEKTTKKAATKTAKKIMTRFPKATPPKSDIPEPEGKSGEPEWE